MTHVQRCVSANECSCGRLAGGWADAIIGRVADAMLSVPFLILAIALPGWVQYARTVRGSTMVERHKEYVQAARSLGAWTFVGCTVSPGFEFAGFELAPAGWAPGQ